MPRPKKRARSSPKSIQQIDDDDDDDEVAVAAVLSSRRTKSNPITNGVKAYSSSPRSRRGKRQKEEEEEEEEDEGASEVDEDGEEHAEEEVTVKEEEDEDEEVVEAIFECPTCKKRFTSKYGRKYHVDNMVCQPGNRIKKAKIERHQLTSFDEDVSGTGGRRRKASLRAAKSIMSLTKTQNFDLDSDDDEDKSVADGGIRDDEFIAEDGGIKSDDDLNTDEENEEQDVGQPKKRGRGRASRKSERRSYSSCDLGERFGVLEKGARFITKFGVVEVIADDRAPEKTIKSKSAATPKTVRSFLNRRQRFRERYDRVICDIAAGTRYRREELSKMYTASKLSTSAAGTSILSQERVWSLYCKSLSLNQILLDGFSSAEEKNGKMEKFSEEDPRSPPDHYPNRIVECRLVEDERECIDVISGNDCSSRENDEAGATGLKYNVRERPSTRIQISPMRLYIARNELVQEYDASTPCYVCKICSHTSRYREGLKYHLSNSLCWEDKKQEKEHRLMQIRAIESKAISGTGCRDTLLTSPHGIVEDAKRRGEPMFGNPHNIKEHKKHQSPPWLVFNDQRSSMYPEIYVTLGFKRGSQNRNYFNKKKQEDGYIPKPEKTRLKKRLGKIRMLLQSETISTTPVPSNSTIKHEATAKKKKSPKTTETPKRMDLPPSLPPCQLTDSSCDLPPALPPLPVIDGHHDMDFGFDYSGMSGDTGFEDTPHSSHFNKSSTSRNGTVARIDNDEIAPDSSLIAHEKNSRRRKQIIMNKKKQYQVIDTQVLAVECDSGRYPSINRYHGDHDVTCTICNLSDDVPLINCDYCKNSVHQLCLDKRMLGKDPQVIIRENEPDDTPMCHVCISTCLFRRWRAENRRSMKWQHELAKAGLGGIPEAANLTEEINLKDDTLRDADIDKPSYEPCPDGGPGGLICCSYCTAAYSRFLSNTAKEMEAQSVSRVGQEVSEVLELLEDAKQRLQRASSVLHSNEVRRGLLEINQSAQN